MGENNSQTPAAPGVGCPGCGGTCGGKSAAGCCPGQREEVYKMLSYGSPRLALARAMGANLAPWKIIVQATFAATATPSVPNVANPTKLIQDVCIDRISFDVTNGNTPTGAFDPLNNFFFAQQSGILANIRCEGAPRYVIIPDLMPIKQIEGDLKEPWIFLPTNGLKMDFIASVPLPFAPVVVTATFHGRTTHWPRLLDMGVSDALNRLRQLGYDCGTYGDFLCG